MKQIRTFLVVVITIFIFWFIKFYLKFPSADLEVIGIILTIASILFGLLAGFFISGLGVRYVEIRELQNLWSAETINMIKYGETFYKNNKQFEKEFKKSVEKSSIVDEIVEWTEGHLALPYFRKISSSFEKLKIKSKKEDAYFKRMLESSDESMKALTRLDNLGKEKLFPSEWIIMITLSLIIALAILFLPTNHIFYRIIILVFPIIIAMTLLLIYNLNSLYWNKEMISLEPNQRILDAIDEKRFYLKEKKEFISKNIKNYRTEDDLKGELKEVYDSILKKRESK